MCVAAAAPRNRQGDTKQAFTKQQPPDDCRDDQQCHAGGDFNQGGHYQYRLRLEHAACIHGNHPLDAPDYKSSSTRALMRLDFTAALNTTWSRSVWSA